MHFKKMIGGCGLALLVLAIAYPAWGAKTKKGRRATPAVKPSAPMPSGTQAYRLNILAVSLNRVSPGAQVDVFIHYDDFFAGSIIKTVLKNVTFVESAPPQNRSSTVDATLALTPAQAAILKDAAQRENAVFSLALQSVK